MRRGVDKGTSKFGTRIDIKKVDWFPFYLKYNIYKKEKRKKERFRCTEAMIHGSARPSFHSDVSIYISQYMHFRN